MYTLFHVFALHWRKKKTHLTECQCLSKAQLCQFLPCRVPFLRRWASFNRSHSFHSSFSLRYKSTAAVLLQAACPHDRAPERWWKSTSSPWHLCVKAFSFCFFRKTDQLHLEGSAERYWQSRGNQNRMKVFSFQINLKHVFLSWFYSFLFSLLSRRLKEDGPQTIHINSPLLGAGNPSRLCATERIEGERKKGGEKKKTLHSLPN